MFYPGNWIHSFPQHFQWSNATLIAKGMAPYAAVALEEIDRVVQRLHQRISEPHAWWEEWGAVAAQVERAADAAAAQGRDATAGNYYLRAGNYYYTGERMLPPGAQKLEMYRKSLRCSHEGLKRRYPTLEIIDVPYEGTALPAYFMKSPTAKRRAPTVVLFDGLDNCKEMSVLFAGVELAFRGFHTLAIDGPGQGEALRLRDLPSRYDYEVPGKAAYEYVASRADVDPERVAIMAYSAGGYYAPRAAAFEKRYAACVAWGPHYDYHAVWQKRWDAMQKDEKANATSHFQLPWVLGVADMETAMEKLKKFTLEGVAQL
ncbi:MAG TPA: alpha/beta fold hydrolase, partial [Burkholderiales bacterium]|nr:alpha/beta fold hydrolase [Burkholderiales bacterium]